jgi:predicted alpha/beta-hydrolase family hydrolase
MARRLRIEWSQGKKVTGWLAMPPHPRAAGMLLAHGAGAGHDHPFMVAVRNALAEAGFPTLTFNYPYIESGRRAPDRLATLLACHRAAADRLAGYVDRVVLAGKSMGGRVGSHLAGDEGYATAGLVYLGYPLVPMGKRELRDTDHLRRIAAPQLFLSGTRDALAPLDLIEEVVASLPSGTLVTIEEGDHSFRVPKRTGMTSGDVVAALVGAVSQWADELA